MVKSGVFIFIGCDEPEKTKKINGLKKKLFPPTLQDLNFNIFYGDDRRLSQRALEESLNSYPSGGALGRLVIIRQAHKLSKDKSRFLLKCLKALPSQTTVILDVNDAKAGGNFLKIFSKQKHEVVRFRSDYAASVFDLGKLILARNPKPALKTLNVLLARKEKGTHLVGGIFWQWCQGYQEGRISDRRYREGLTLLQEADQRLKTSSSWRYSAEPLVLESLIIKLSYLA